MGACMVNGRTDGWLIGWLVGSLVGQMVRSFVRSTDGGIDKWIGGQVVDWFDGHTYGQTEE